MRNFINKIFFRLAFLLSVFFTCSVHVAGQYQADDIPIELFPFADEVVRLENKRVEVKSERSATLYQKTVITILSDKSDANKFALPYNKKCKLKKLEISLYDKDGQFIRKADRSEYQDFPADHETGEYSSDRYKYIEVNYDAYPYSILIDYEQELSGIPFAVFPDWKVGSFGRAVEKAEFIVDVPNGFDILYKSSHLDIDPEIQIKKTRKIYSWRIQNLNAVPEESFSPSADELLPQILVSPVKFQIDNFSGSLDSWENYSAFVHRLFESRSTIPEDLKRRVKQISSSVTSVEEKVRLLYRFMQSEVRYVSIQFGIGGWQPFPPKFVFEKKYGDCKALTNYMYAILKVAGIQSYPVLIKNGTTIHELHNNFASPDFNHVILYVPETDSWLECTNNSYPPNYIGWSNCGRKALLIKARGGNLISTPTLSPSDNLESHKIDVHLKEDGGATILVRQQASGGTHEEYRYIHWNLPSDEQVKWLQKKYSISMFLVESLDIESLVDSPKSMMQVRANVQRYAARAGKRLFVPLNRITAHTNIPPEEEDRVHDVVIQNGFQEIDTIHIQFPENCVLESIFKERVMLESAFGNYTLEVVENEPSSITLRRKFTVFQTRQAPEFYEDLRSFLKSIAHADAQMLVLLEGKSQLK